MSACLGKTVALRIVEKWSFGLGRLTLRRLGRLCLSALLRKTVALSTKRGMEVDIEGVRVKDVFDHVDIRGIGGMRVGAVRQHYEYVRLTRPTIIYLDIGANDLSKSWCNPYVLAGAIHDCARVVCMSF